MPANGRKRQRRRHEQRTNSSRRCPWPLTHGRTSATARAPSTRPIRRAGPGGRRRAAPAQAPSKPSGRHSEPRPVSSAATTTRNVTLSLPASLVAQIRQRARQDRASQPEVLLDALSATESELDALLADATPRPVSDGLFVRRTPRPVTPDPLSTLSLRLLSTNLEAIDALVTKHGAASRSALCGAALRRYLSTQETTAK